MVEFSSVMTKGSIYNIAFPFTRHLQRYELAVSLKLITDKKVIDVGCGTTLGTSVLLEYAKYVLGCDVNLIDNAILVIAIHNEGNENGPIEKRHALVKAAVEEVEDNFDIGVAIEVFEHVQDPKKFIKHLSKICDYIWITTPLAKETGKTRNPEHVMEYSAEDFNSIVKCGFHILGNLFQTGSMEIKSYGEYTGDSFAPWHTVQIIYGKSKRLE